MSIWHIGILGPWLTLLPFGVGAVVGILMMDALFFHNRRVPLVSVHTPSQDPKLAGSIYCAALLAAAFVVARAEKMSFDAPGVYVGLLATLVGVSGCLRRFDRVSPGATIDLEVDEDESLPTQRFSLSSF